MMCIFYMSANHTMYILNLYFGKISNTKLQKKNEGNNYYNKNLNLAINKTREELKTLTEKHNSVSKNWNDFTTWIKGTLVIYSIKQQQNKLCKKNERNKSKET